MIKFFRKIRQNLLIENKTGKYFKYAIGEIVLVVIGILIALSINNWNENRKKSNQEKELLTQLESEFQSNLEQLEEKIKLRDIMISSSIKLLEFVDEPNKRNIDSIYYHIGFTLLAPTFDPIVNEITSTGRIQLLNNNELKTKLSRWTSDVIQVTEEEKAWANYQERHYSTLLKHSSLRTISNIYWHNSVSNSFQLDKSKRTKFDLGNSNKQVDIINLLDNSNFEDHLAICTTLAKIANSQSQSLKIKISDILDLIKAELKK